MAAVSQKRSSEVIFDKSQQLCLYYVLMPSFFSNFFTFDLVYVCSLWKTFNAPGIYLNWDPFLESPEKFSARKAIFRVLHVYVYWTTSCLAYYCIFIDFDSVAWNCLLIRVCGITVFVIIPLNQ